MSHRFEGLGTAYELNDVDYIDITMTINKTTEMIMCLPAISISFLEYSLRSSYSPFKEVLRLYHVALRWTTSLQCFKHILL